MSKTNDTNKLTKNFTVDEFLHPNNPDFRRQLKVYKFKNLPALAKLLQKGRYGIRTLKANEPRPTAAKNGNAEKD